jgi:hypothetical protein
MVRFRHLLPGSRKPLVYHGEYQPLRTLQRGDPYDISFLAAIQNELIRHTESLQNQLDIARAEITNLRYDMEEGLQLDHSVMPVGRNGTHVDYPS